MGVSRETINIIVLYKLMFKFSSMADMGWDMGCRTAIPRKTTSPSIVAPCAKGNVVSLYSLGVLVTYQTHVSQKIRIREKSGTKKSRKIMRHFELAYT